MDLLDGRLPEGVTAIGLVGCAGGRRSAALAIRAAAALGRRHRRLILASLEGSMSFLDQRLGVDESPGLAAVLSRTRRLVDVALPSRDKGFIYVPAGSSEEHTGRLLASPGLAILVRRVRERRGLLLLYLPEARWAAAARERGLVDLVVQVGEIPGPSAQVPAPARASPEVGSTRRADAVRSIRRHRPRTSRRQSGRPRRVRWRAGLGVALLLTISALLAWAGTRLFTDAASLDLLLQSLQSNGATAP